MIQVNGTLSVEGAAPSDADVHLLGSDFKVVDATTADTQGHYTLHGADLEKGWLLTRFRAPVIGARLEAISAGQNIVHDVALHSQDLITLTGDILLKDYEDDFDWATVHLTPRQLPNTSQDCRLALLRNGTQPGMRGTFVQTRVQSPSFSFKVLPTLYDLRVERIIDGGLMETPQPNLTLHSITLSDGQQASSKFGGFEFSVGHDDLHIKAMLTPSKEH